MIGYIEGHVLFSDGKEAIIQSQSGLGYQLHCYTILPEGSRSSVFISHIVRETSEELFSFKNLREKKLFELLLSVKGVGPRSAYSVLSQLGVQVLVSSIKTEDKATLKSVVGVGDKAASQMILDLRKKIQTVMMYSEKTPNLLNSSLEQQSEFQGSFELESMEIKELDAPSEEFSSEKEEMLNETLLACQNLGFQQQKIVSLAQKILQDHEIQKTEQLIHLVLKEI